MTTEPSQARKLDQPTTTLADVLPYAGPLAGLLTLYSEEFDDLHFGGTFQVSRPMRPMIIGRLAQRHPLLVVTTTSLQAQELQDNVAAWVGAENVEIFPAWETMPHEKLSPQVATVGQRLKVLNRLRDNNLRIVIAPVRAVMQPMDPRLADRDPLIVGGPNSFDRGLDEFANTLSNLGYSRTTMVQDKGEFAIRGGLIDVFPTVAQNPVRIEFFGDDIDEIREFDPEDQRTIRPIDGITIFPARELILDNKTAELAKELVNLSPTLQENLTKLSEHIAFEGAEGLVTAMLPENVSIIDLMGEEASIVVADHEEVLDRSIKLVKQSMQLMVSDWAANLLSDLGEHALATALEQHKERGGFYDWERQLENIVTRSTQSGASNKVWQFSAFKTSWTLETFNCLPWETFKGNVDRLTQAIVPYCTKQTSHIVLAVRDEGTAKRMATVLQNANIPVEILTESKLDTPTMGMPRKPDGRARIVVAPLQTGFISSDLGLVLLGEYDLFGARRTAARRRSGTHETAEQLVLNLNIGDPIVHDIHGIGRYGGMVTRELPGTSTVSGGSAGTITRDYVLVEYLNEAKLFVPSDQVDMLTVYSGGDNPRIMRIGGSDWTRTKQKVKEEVKAMTAELTRLYRVRHQIEGHAFDPDKDMLATLENSFPFVETRDQLATIEDVKRDMASPKPMDRLVCGDVGFGKTEVAVRAAAVAVFDGKQVAVLVPTTLLAQQHGETFTSRFSGMPVTVRILSRFTPQAEINKTLADLAIGKVDIVVGTHRLLSEDIRFYNLGLVVVDEEQRFGVAHKERLKQLKTTVDVLSMSATPIPRTMEMAIMGIRDMSKIETAPMDRLPVITQVTPWDQDLAILAVRREMLRDGQVFWLHNKVSTIEQTAAWLRSQIPDARIAVGHGQMPETVLEKIMVDFWNREYDVLIATTIIENGINIENANTLIVERADMLGMSQLYQLRGRVGRSAIRGHAHFFYPGKDSITEDAWKRLEGIATHTRLGSGMAIAMEDLSIRGAGSLLGAEQSGSVNGVGLETYAQIVNESVAELTDQPVPENEVELRVNIPLDAYIPTEWIDNESLRLQAYRRISAIRNANDLQATKETLTDRFGAMPPPAQRLLSFAAVKSMLRMWKIELVTTTPRSTIRIEPVTLAESRQIRLQRKIKNSVYDEAGRAIELPMPSRKQTGDLLSWLAARLVDILGSPDT